MADTTTDETEMTREETAEFLRGIADELDSGTGRVRVPVGNKEVQLSPPGSIDLETTVTERSRRLRKDTEELTLTFRWNPTGDTGESGTDPDAESDSGMRTESGPDNETDR